MQEAIDLPRVLHVAGVSEVEGGVPLSVVDGLAPARPPGRAVGAPHGGGQAIRVDRARGVLIGGSDPRKDGMALGY